MNFYDWMSCKQIVAFRRCFIRWLLILAIVVVVFFHCQKERGELRVLISGPLLKPKDDGNKLKDKSINLSGDWNRHSQLSLYTTRETVKCLDALHQHKLNRGYLDNSHTSHLLFVGDSRIRQLFFNFLKLIPNYDRRLEISEEYGFINVTEHSQLLNLQVSYIWNYIVGEDLYQRLSTWLNLYITCHKVPDKCKDEPLPFFILLGVSSHQMLRKHGANHFVFKENMILIRPLLIELTKYTRIVWLYQYPTVEFYGNINASNTDVVSQKLHHYNQIVRRVLSGTEVIIWDSCSPIVEEYIRGCSLLSRRKTRIQENFAGPRPYDGYFLCNDYIHPGFVAVSQMTQILLNDICNNSLL